MDAKTESQMDVTDEEFNEIVNNSHKIVVVDFFAEWCMPCLMISPIIDELSESMNEVKFVKMNIDENKDLAANLNVSSIPCIIIFKEGKEVDRLIGAQPQEAIEDKIKAQL